MNSLEQIKADIKSEIKVNERGVGIATIRGTARLVNVHHSTLIKAFDSGVIKTNKLAQMLVQQSFDPVAFSQDGVPDLAVAIVAKYYAYFAGARCTELAKLADLAFSGMGVRAWFQELVGWEKPLSNAIVKNDVDEIEAILMAMLDTRRQVKTLQQDNDYLKTEVAEIKANKQQAEQALKLLPAPEVTTPALEVRTQINRVLRDFVFTTNCDHQFAWRMLYREFRDLYHIDLYARAKNSGMNKLDICEALGMLKDLYAVAYRLFVEAA